MNISVDYTIKYKQSQVDRDKSYISETKCRRINLRHLHL